jgi:hypothetical protein
VNTLTGNLRAVYAAGSRLTVTGEGFYDDRDNRTAQDEFVQVGTDTFVGPATHRIAPTATSVSGDG